MSVESADKNFERKRNEMKTMVGLEIAKTQKTQGFPGTWVRLVTVMFSGSTMVTVDSVVPLWCKLL